MTHTTKERHDMSGSVLTCESCNTFFWFHDILDSGMCQSCTQHEEDTFEEQEAEYLGSVKFESAIELLQGSGKSTL